MWSLLLLYITIIYYYYPMSDTDTQTHRHTQTQTHTQTHRHTQTHTHRHTDTHRHTQTHTHTHRHTHLLMSFRIQKSTTCWASETLLMPMLSHSHFTISYKITTSMLINKQEIFPLMFNIQVIICNIKYSNTCTCTWLSVVLVNYN